MRNQTNIEVERLQKAAHPSVYKVVQITSIVLFAWGICLLVCPNALATGGALDLSQPGDVLYFALLLSGLIPAVLYLYGSRRLGLIRADYLREHDTLRHPNVPGIFLRMYMPELMAVRKATLAVILCGFIALGIDGVIWGFQVDQAGAETIWEIVKDGGFLIGYIVAMMTALCMMAISDMMLAAFARRTIRLMDVRA